MKYKLFDIISGVDGDEIIVSIEGNKIYTRVLDEGGNMYTEDELVKVEAGESLDD
jgi:hypothetical protein